jgi:hypothetical protein
MCSASLRTARISADNAFKLCICFQAVKLEETQSASTKNVRIIVENSDNQGETFKANKVHVHDKHVERGAE